MTKDELEQRVNDARAKNLDGTVSRKWHDAIEYALRAENERLQGELEGWRGSAAHFADEVGVAEAEIAKLREALRKVERYALEFGDLGQRCNGTRRTANVCRVCGAVIETLDSGHRDFCAFKILENKFRKASK